MTEIEAVVISVAIRNQNTDIVTLRPVTGADRAYIFDNIFKLNLGLYLKECVQHI